MIDTLFDQVALMLVLLFLLMTLGVSYAMFLSLSAQRSHAP